LEASTSQDAGFTGGLPTALEMRAILDRGGDPLDERDRIKSMPTFSEFVRQEYLPYAYQAKRSAHDDDSKFRLHLEPKWGALRLCVARTPAGILFWLL